VKTLGGERDAAGGKRRDRQRIAGDPVVAVADEQLSYVEA
jgi:hypothetical protein